MRWPFEAAHVEWQGEPPRLDMEDWKMLYVLFGRPRRAERLARHLASREPTAPDPFHGIVAT